MIEHEREHKIDWSDPVNRQDEHFVRYQDQLEHVSSLSPKALPTFERTYKAGRRDPYTGEWLLSDVKRNIAFKPQEVRRLVEIASFVRRRNFIETGASPKMADAIMARGRRMRP